MDTNFSDKETPEQVAQNVVVSIDYTLNVEGEVVDFSDKDDPLEYLQGHGQIIPGLEKALEGMKIGENKEVLVRAEEAYGEDDPNAVVEVSREDFPPDFAFEIGTSVQVRNSDGEVLEATITDLSEEQVELDFNHPLAGKDLLFNVTVVGLRQATSEELEHGHVHGEHGHDDEDDWEDWDEDDEEDLFIDEDEDEEEDNNGAK